MVLTMRLHSDGFGIPEGKQSHYWWTSEASKTLL